MVVQTDALGNSVERLTRDNLRAHLCQKALVLVGELDKEIIRRYAFDHCITQKLKSFVVYMLPVVERYRGRFMDQCQLVKFDVVGNESEHIVDGTIKDLVLAEVAAQRTKKKIYQNVNYLQVITNNGCHTQVRQPKTM